MIKINPDELKVIAGYIYDISGIFLDQNKAYLFETRLNRLLEETNSSSYRELYNKSKTDSDKNLERKIIDAITTNETLFFRDSSPFEMFKYKILPDLIDLRTSRAIMNKPVPLRIWSAACSTGQELYSIAIVMKELLGDLNKYNLKLFGTDISDAAVYQASRGIYNKFEIERGLPMDKLNRYFTPSGNSWKIRDEIRAMVSFKKFNLMSSFAGLGKQDVVFCRNVAIYFNLEDRKKLFNKIADVLEPDGYLVIGSTESLTGVCSRFEPKRHLRAIFYQLVS